MRLTIRHRHLRSTHAVDAVIEERILALEPRLDIEAADVWLEHHRESSPAFRVHVHLVTPGPDLLAEGRDHTLRAAIRKALNELEQRIGHRRLKRTQRLKSNLHSPLPGRTARG